MGAEPFVASLPSDVVTVMRLLPSTTSGCRPVRRPPQSPFPVSAVPDASERSPIVPQRNRLRRGRLDKFPAQ